MTIEAMKDALITLVFARGSIEDWGGYASEYFQNKYDLKGDISKVDKAITSLRQAIEQAEKQVCVGCEGNPQGDNIPCVVCGATPQPQQEQGASLKKLQVTLEDRPIDIELAQYKRMFEAACSALGEVSDALGCDPEEGGAEPLIAAIERLKSSSQEPVAWMVYTLDGKSVCVTDNPTDFTDEHRALPLYTTPQPQREWVGLTDGLKVILIKNAPNWTVIQLIEETEQLLKDQNS